jgi:hypothetical protein
MSPMQPPPAGAPALRSSAAAPAAQPRTAAAAPVAQQSRTAPAPQRAAPVAAAPTVSTFDKILAIAACVTALAAVGTTVLMLLNAALSQ